MEGNNVILIVSVWAVIGLIGLSLLALAGFGLRSLAYGKVEPLSIVVIAVPAVLLVVLGFAMETWAQAGIMTLLVMLGISLLGLVYTGITNLFW